MKQIVPTVRLYLLFIFSLIAYSISAQEASEEDTIQVKWLNPSFIIDYGKLLTIPSSFEQKLEGGVELLFIDRVSLIGEYGNAMLTPDEAINGTYESNGSYFRVGLGYSKPRNTKNRIGIFMLYGSSQFDENLRYELVSTSGSQATFSQSIARPNLEATWGELMIYTDQKMNRFITLGFNIRYRRLISTDRFSPIDVYAIPGYGRAFDKSIPAANLILKITLLN